MMATGPICVIFNPAAGRGQARRMIRAIRREIDTELHLQPTKHPGHAIKLARSAALDGYSVIVAAGGDGTVHEVANGILQADCPDVVFSVWPIGSANDYAFALGIKHRRPLAPRVEPSTRGASGLRLRKVDVGRVEAGGKSAFYVNCLGVGFNGAVTLESRRITWLRGMPLYGLATLKALWRHFDQPTMRVQFDDLIRETPTLALSVNLGVREGNFPVTPDAKLDDGWFDAVHAGPLTRWQAIKLLPRMATGTLQSNDANLWLGRCRKVVVESPIPVRVHVDGEFFCQPEDGIRELKIELLPGRLSVLATPE
jgi:diacylglycerol kinase (ATP)